MRPEYRGELTAGVACEPPRAPEELSRKRLIALANLALKTVEFVEKNGIKPNEWCEFGRLCSDLSRRK